MVFASGMSRRVYLGLLNRRFSIVSSGELADVCKAFGFPAKSVRVVLVRKGFLVPVLFKGLFYVRSANEALSGALPDVFELVALACNKRFGKEWYFGLRTALSAFDVAGIRTQTKAFVIVKKQVVPSVRRVGGLEVVFSQLKGASFIEGVEERGGLRFSEPVRAVLDFLHFGVKAGNQSEGLQAMADVIQVVGVKKFDRQSQRLLKNYSTKASLKKIIDRRRGPGRVA